MLLYYARTVTLHSFTFYCMKSRIICQFYCNDMTGAFFSFCERQAWYAIWKCLNARNVIDYDVITIQVHSRLAFIKNGNDKVFCCHTLNLLYYVCHSDSVTLPVSYVPSCFFLTMSSPAIDSQKLLKLNATNFFFCTFSWSGNIKCIWPELHSFLFTSIMLCTR